MVTENTFIGGNYNTINTTQFYYRPEGFSSNFASGIFVNATDGCKNGGGYISAGTIREMIVNVTVAGTGNINFWIYKNFLQEAGTVLNVTTTGLYTQTIDLDMAEGDLYCYSSKGVGIAGTWRWRMAVTGEFDE
jgi:hypothetical protein